ncbi:hypothetical protein [Flavobacterium sp. SM2513]|uniref:hypothetical protein n=1 Tax=Flavobacterium sp. SM2513 TaxID=3424766 RepID=UPI003D7F6E02
MKKLVLLLFVSFIAISCSVDDNESKYYYDFLPVESFEVPESFDFGKVYTISIFFKRPNNCHASQTLYFEKKDSTRIIAVQSLVLDKNNCTALPDEEPKQGTFQFEVVNTSSYIFKFYKGKDDNGEDVFEEVIIPVNNQ